MQRLKTGGVRLRVITALTGVMAIAAGVYAGYSHRSTGCTILPSSIFEGKAVHVTCELNAFATYTISRNGVEIWNTSSSGNGSGSSAANCIGLSSNYSAPAEAESLDLYFCTKVDVTDSDAKLRLIETGPTNYDTNEVPAYNLSFTGSDSSVSAGSPMKFAVQNLVNNENVKFGEVTSSQLPSNAHFDVSGAAGGGGSSGDPYTLSSSSPYLSPAGAASSGSTTKWVKSANSGSQVYIGVYDASNTLIGVYGPFNVT